MRHGRRAVPKRATACRHPACWTGRVMARVRSWSAQPPSQHRQGWSGWSRRGRRRQACCSWLSPGGPGPGHACCHGPRRASPASPAPGRQAGRAAPKTPAPGTVHTGPAPVREARLSRWSRAKTPSFPPAPGRGVASARRAPPPGSGQGEAGRAGRTTCASPSAAPRATPRADAPHGAPEPRWRRRSPSPSRLQAGVPAIRGSARTRLTAAAMRRSVTSRWRPMMSRNYRSLPEVLTN